MSLGFGNSPTWHSQITKRRFDEFVCGLRTFRGHWFSPSYEGPGRALMFSYISSSRVLIAPETLCALSGIGWNLRPKGPVSTPTTTPTTTPNTQTPTNTTSQSAPPPPQNLQVEAITSSSARVSWDASAGATDYDLFYRVASTSDWVKINQNTALYRIIENLERGTRYHWTVRAENSAGPSDWVYGPAFHDETLMRRLDSGGAGRFFGGRSGPLGSGRYAHTRHPKRPARRRMVGKGKYQHDCG